MSQTPKSPATTIIILKSVILFLKVVVRIFCTISGKPILITPLKMESQPIIVITTLQSATQTLCKITVATPRGNASQPESIIKFLSAFTINSSSNVAFLLKRKIKANITRNHPQNCAKKIVVSII